MKPLSILFILSLLVMSFAVINTQLHVTVRDELGNLVEGATIQLYANEQDFTKEVNKVAEATTDKKGIARFKSLNATVCYVIVRKDDKDNAGAAEQTGKLDAGRINKVTIIIQ